MDVSDAFHPFTFRGYHFPSRIVLAPINTGFARAHRPSHRLLAFQVERAGQAVGLNFLGNVSVCLSDLPNPGTAVLAKPIDVHRFAVLARAIRRKGSLAGIQLARSIAGLSPNRSWRPLEREAEIVRLRALVRSLAVETIERCLQEFRAAARLSRDAGFDVIQVHMAHGYLLSLLLSPVFNERGDRFRADGDWLEEFVVGLREDIESSLLSARVSTLLGVTKRDDELRLCADLAGRLSALGVDIIDLSAGIYTLDRRMIYPTGVWNAPVYADALPLLTSHVNGLTIVGGRLTQLSDAARFVSPGTLVAFGRAMIADPEFASKSLNGHEEEVVRCRLTNRCHYFSRGKSHIECGVNPGLVRRRDD